MNHNCNLSDNLNGIIGTSWTKLFLRQRHMQCFFLSLSFFLPSTAACGCCGKSSWTLAVPSASASARWWPGCRPSSGPWPGRQRWCRSSPRRCTAGRPSATAPSSSGRAPSHRSACRWSCSWSPALSWCRRWCRRSPWLWSSGLGARKEEHSLTCADGNHLRSLRTMHLQFF